MKNFRRFPIHPLLWALFPVLALLGNNISHIQPVSSIRTLLATILLVLLVLGIFGVILKNWRKAAVISTGFVFLFFSYGRIYNLVQNRLLLGINVGRHRVLFPLFFLLLILLVVWVIKLKEIGGLTSALNLIGVLALIFPLYQVISYRAGTSLEKLDLAPLRNQVSALQLPPGGKPPDIYYIILDTYTRQDTLSQVFSYDNSGFINALESDGFFVAGCSQSNYPLTADSLASTLNLNYLLDISTHLSPENQNISDIYPYLSDNSVVYALRKLGYRFETVETGFSPTEFKHADVYYTPAGNWQEVMLGDGINSFESMLLNTSAGMLFYEFSSYLPPQMRTFLSAYVLHRERILYELNLLDQMAAQPGPKFVFIHILAPHNPFVFGPNGEFIERSTPFTLNDDREVISDEIYASGYVDQVNYLNLRILSAVDSLIKNSSQPPIILLQGDHGVPRLPEWRDTILNAYYLPGTANHGLYPGISPVNSFRVIFNDYFGGQLPMLADRSCVLNSDGDPFSCTPIVDPNPQCAAMNSTDKP